MLYTCRRSEELLARGGALRTPSQHFAVDHTHPAQGEGALDTSGAVSTEEFRLILVIDGFSLFG